MKLKFIFPAAFLFLSTFSSVAQTSESSGNSDWKDRIFVGGTAGLSFGTITYIEIAPLIGYKITDNWSAGVGARYAYFSDKFYDYQTSIYGGMAFTRYMIYQGIFAAAEFEANNFETYGLDDMGNLITKRLWVPSLLLGGGYSQSIGGKASLYIEILYDVLQDPNSPYLNQPVIRMGVTIGL